MNKGELITAVAGYLHRTDMNEQINASVAIATARIGRDLRDRFNYAFSSVEVGYNLAALPGDVADLNMVLFNNKPLQALTSTQILKMNQNSPTGAPVAYAVEGGAMSFSPPIADGEYINLGYYARPAALENDADSNDVLAQYPQLYVYACLMESFFWTQDGELTEYATVRYTNEIKLINQQYEAANVGSSPIMRRV